MNRADKLVASRTLTGVGAWANSSLIDGDAVAALPGLAAERDVIVIGSTGLVHDLAARDLVEEYRQLVFPTVPGGVSGCSRRADRASSWSWSRCSGAGRPCCWSTAGAGVATGAPVSAGRRGGTAR
jgi:hypothetical protein